ncbi:MAG TPA: outer membrane lipoprotein-sorting protein [Firmicutes bacterium]|nr:outer membrane lipoprotein-sorting protein [Bacillota bacterium]
MLRVRLHLVAGFLILALVALPVAASGLTGEDILERIDHNAYLKGAKIRATLTIVSGGREITKSLVSFVDGDRSFTEFTNARDRGTKYLKLGDELWMFFPDAEDVVKISGHLLRQGMMGSDFSYEDALESKRLASLYQVKLAGEEKVDGRDCYVLELSAKPGVEVSYARRKQWITQAEFVPVKEELYAQSGKLLKVLTAGNLKRIGDRWFAFEATMENKLKKGSRTRMTIEELELNVAIPPQTFSREALHR